MLWIARTGTIHTPYELARSLSLARSLTRRRFAEPMRWVLIITWKSADSKQQQQTSDEQKYNSNYLCFRLVPTTVHAMQLSVPLWRSVCDVLLRRANFVSHSLYSK